MTDLLLMVEVIFFRGSRPDQEAGKCGITMKRMRVDFVFDSVGPRAESDVNLITN